VIRTALTIACKEARDSLRERHTRIAMLTSAGFLLVWGITLLNRFHVTEAGAGELSPEARAAVGRLLVSLPLYFLALFGSFISVPAALESFVGERERRTAETLLAAPVREGTLFLGKCLGALAPALILEGGLMVLAGPYLIFRATLPPLAVDRAVAVEAALSAVPPAVLLPLAITGFATAISSIAHTVKGAGQLFGVSISLVCVGIYGAAQLLPGSDAGRFLAESIQGLTFREAYAAATVGLALVTAFFLAVGRLAFRRERLVAGGA
jgi:ABC-type Na+ efflux pump permease subunit